MKNIRNIILLLLLLSGCRMEGQNSQQKIVQKVKRLEIDIDKSTCLKFSEVFDHPIFIPLETTSNNLFSSPLQTVVTDSNIFIVPKDPNYMILIFKKDGKSFNNIYNVGRGPNEYLGFYYIDVDEIKKAITIFDLGSRSFITMDYKGNFLKKVPVKQFYTYRFIKHPESGKIVADISNSGLLNKSDNNNYQILLFDPIAGEIETFLPASLPHSVLTENNLFNYNENVYFKPIMIDTIFQVLKNGISPSYILDFKNHSKSSELMLTKDKIRFKELRNNGDIALHFDFKETDGFIYSAHETFDLRKYFHLYNKRNSKSNVYSKMINDYIGQKEESDILFRDFPIALYKDNIIFMHEPTQILRDYAEFKRTSTPEQYSKYMRENPGFARLVATIKEESNPVLGFYKIR